MQLQTEQLKSLLKGLEQEGVKTLSNISFRENMGPMGMNLYIDVEVLGTTKGVPISVDSLREGQHSLDSFRLDGRWLGRQINRQQEAAVLSS